MSLKPSNKASSTRVFVITLGTLTALVGIGHGIFDILHGNTPTGAYLSESLGGFTVIPNYLITGVVAVIIGSLTIFWTVSSIHKKFGPTVYLILSILLFLVGGGIAQVLGFLITWVVANRINKPLTWWQRTLPEGLRKQLTKLWLVLFIMGFSFLAIGICIWSILVPPSAEIKEAVINYVCWSFLGIGLVFIILTIVSGFARDIEKQKETDLLLRL